MVGWMLVLNLCSGYFRLDQRGLSVHLVISSYFDIFVKIFWKVYIWKRRNYLLRFVGNKLLGSWDGLVLAVGWVLTCVVWNSAVGQLSNKLIDRWVGSIWTPHSKWNGSALDLLGQFWELNAKLFTANFLCQCFTRVRLNGEKNLA